MDKSEYKTITFTNTAFRDLETQLNIYGANGWELVTCNVIIKPEKEWYRCIFKRKIKE